MNFLFWNLNKKQEAYNILHTIACDEDVDVMMVAEVPCGQSAINGYQYLSPINGKDAKVRVFYRNTIVINEIYSGRLFSAQKIALDDINFNLIACHLHSKVNCNENEQRELSANFVKEILEFEESCASNNTVVCGDFNMNPFDSGMIYARSFHAVMDRHIAINKHRTIQGEKYSYFYNPMWNCLGDKNTGDAPGTYYYNKSEYEQYFWHILDQVILRPNMIPYFDDDQLRIIGKTRQCCLLTQNNKINQTISDHLPVKFSFKNNKSNIK